MASEETAKKAFPVDLLVILVLVVGLVAATMIAGRGGAKQAAETPAPAVPTTPQRTVLPEQIGYRELAAVPLQGRAHGVTVGDQDHVFISAGFTIIELASDQNKVKQTELETAARCLDAYENKLYLGCGDHVEVMDLENGTVTAWDSLGESAFITSIAVADDTVVIGDAGNRRFLRCGLDGTLKDEIEAPTQQGIIINNDVPSTYFDVAAAPDGTFWATEAGHLGVVHYNSQGERLGRFGEGSSAIEDFGGCCNPTHVAVAPDGAVVTVEKKPDLVKTYTTDGEFRNVVAGPKAFTLKTFISDVAANSKGTIYVLDPKRKQLRIFEPK